MGSSISNMEATSRLGKIRTIHRAIRISAVSEVRMGKSGEDMTNEQELKVVELCKQFMNLADEINLCFIDLCRIRDKYFPVINSRRMQNPADIAKSVQILEDHCKEMKAVLSQSMGVKVDEGVLVTDKKENAKIAAAKPIAVSPAKDPNALVLDKFVDDYDMGGPKTKWKVRSIIERGRSNGALTKKEIEYLKEKAKGQPLDTFLSVMRVEG